MSGASDVLMLKDKKTKLLQEVEEVLGIQQQHEKASKSKGAGNRLRY